MARSIIPPSGEHPLPLPTPEQRNPPHRPAQSDPRAIAGAAKKLAKLLVEWDHQITLEEAEQDLTAALAAGRCDGYEIAKHLEDRRGYSPDSELVSDLDVASHYLSEAHKTLVKEWVQVNGIRPKFKVGDEVETKRFGRCVIGAINEETANYVVQNEVFRRDFPNQPSTAGYYVPFERVTAVGADAEA